MGLRSWLLASVLISVYLVQINTLEKVEKCVLNSLKHPLTESFSPAFCFVLATCLGCKVYLVWQQIKGVGSYITKFRAKGLGRVRGVVVVQISRLSLCFFKEF